MDYIEKKFYILFLFKAYFLHSMEPKNHKINNNNFNPNETRNPNWANKIPNNEKSRKSSFFKDTLALPLSSNYAEGPKGVFFKKLDFSEQNNF